KSISLSNLSAISSCPSLIITEDQSDKEQHLTIPLSSGDTIVLPKYNADIQYIETAVLEEILFYLDALEPFNSDFESLQTTITHQLGKRGTAQRQGLGKKLQR